MPNLSMWHTWHTAQAFTPAEGEMDLATLLGTLTAEGFGLGVVGCNAIELRGPMHRLTPALREALAHHKPTLLALLGTDAEALAERVAIQRECEAPADAMAFPFGANTRCLAHMDRSQWVDSPDSRRPSWIRTTCGKCGVFIGYRPEEL